MDTTTDGPDPWLVDAVGVIAARSMRLIDRLMYAAMALEAMGGEDPTHTEREWALRAGMSPHQARQAISGLIREGLVERGWRHPASGPGKPVPIYRPRADEWPDQEVANG